MKPLRIFRHLTTGSLGYLETFLEKNNLSYEVICIDAGVTIPMGLDDISGLVFMGAAVSVNDPLSWMEQELELIGKAIEHDVPVMGICFGAQLMSRALAGEVVRAPGMAIGWHQIKVVSPQAVAPWLAHLPASFDAFQWHADTFSIPPGASPLFHGGCSHHQGFVYGDHLAMQFHLEMTEEMIRGWIKKYGSDLQRSSSCVQAQHTFTDQLQARLIDLHHIADQIYGGWLSRIRARPISEMESP
jgi:GMP synthase-like glutamine amidotransferase